MTLSVILKVVQFNVRKWRQAPPSCEDSIGCMHGSSEPDLRNWKSPTPQFTQGARPDEHP
ncbi:hypothetical protein FYA67_02215 [Bordetella holmesii]|nr:hypothetical protein FYB59_02215 [Bordetella holmesii]QGB13911.1 hypothetical protein FYB57_02215 [Bordetella holmesii]QGB63156.1 hypothetical protein FYB43_02215 [Bordetella holmesii]QGC41703.1 hypothetical protein FYB19_02215 [Bordetella holmesii]QGC61610.1 hypothetical protein FYB13_02215 [Bordetella holmesii]